MRAKLAICFFVLLLLQSILYRSYAQTPKLRFEHLTIEDGLSNNSVSSILQDRKGYLWFGTFDGLNKYDGYEFTTYEHAPQDTTTLIQNSVFCLWEDKEGIIWIGTAAGGISKFDRSTAKFTDYHPVTDSGSFVPPLRAVSAISEDSEGYLWIGNWLGELRRFDKKASKFFPEKYGVIINQDKAEGNTFSKLRNRTARGAIRCLYKDSSGTLWVGNTFGLHQVKLTPNSTTKTSEVSFKHYVNDPANPRSLSHNTVTSIFEDRAGTLWIGTGGGGLNKLDRETGHFTRYRNNPEDPLTISSDHIMASNIAEDTAGNLWIGTAYGLNKLNNDRTVFERYMHDRYDPQSLSNNFIYSLFLDRSGILWVGTYSEGVEKLDLHQKPFKLYRHTPADDSSLSNDTVTSIYGNTPYLLWVGTWGGGLNAFNKKTEKFIHYKHDPGNSKSLPSDLVNDILDVGDGNLWIRCSNSLSVFNPQTGRFLQYPFATEIFKLNDKDGIISMYTDRQGLLWFGTQNGIKSFDRKTGETTHYRHDPADLTGLSDYTSNVMLQDKRGHIWVGHGSVGLSKLDKETGLFTHYLPDPSDSTTLSTSIVYSIFEDSEGKLWFGTRGGGLCEFDPEKEIFTTYTKKHGLADNTISSIQEDNSGNLWLVTGKGLSSFSPTTKTFTNYDSGDGVNSSLFARTSSTTGIENTAFKGEDGILYYGGTDGLTAFDPRQLKRNRYVPPVVITKFKLFDKLIPGKEEAAEIALKHDENFFTFEFSALNYANTPKNQYAYQLQGVDKDWVYSGTRRIASYTAIEPGEYTFLVKGSNNDGVWNNQGTSFFILIKPPWWRTWVAYAFYLLCFLAGLVIVDRFQRLRLIERERVKVRDRELAQAREIEKAYHELKQTQAQLIQREKMASLGELAAGVAHEIQNPLNFVNNFSEVSKELCQELKDELAADHKQEASILAESLVQNISKIHHHGLRADSIVKGMLQHARSSTGVRQLTDINALADEFLRLTYHGYQIKHKGYSANLVADYSATIGKVDVVPQEMGSVFLNLFNNAFYATGEKKALLNGQYHPEVKVSTSQSGERVEIRVRDNGTGIPEKVRDKIFQPFYTTKPTGQGTGLGLSLSYDIITKGHGGELRVESREGEYTEFVILLPKSLQS